jgi:hypothetical protein
MEIDDDIVEEITNNNNCQSYIKSSSDVEDIKSIMSGEINDIAIGPDDGNLLLRKSTSEFFPKHVNDYMFMPVMDKDHINQFGDGSKNISHLLKFKQNNMNNLNSFKPLVKEDKIKKVKKEDSLFNFSTFNEMNRNSIFYKEKKKRKVQNDEELNDEEDNFSSKISKKYGNKKISMERTTSFDFRTR